MTFDIAMTGIKAASIELDVISNNIANNATTGFKKSNTQFSDLYPAALPGFAAVATGQGVKVAKIKQDFAQGDVTFTNNNLDLSIAGGGFFRVVENDTPKYTRAGSFGLDRDGYITNSAGERLTGYTTDANDQIMPILTDLQVDYSDIAPKSTDAVQLSMNLDTSAEVLPAFDVNDPATFNFSTSTTVYDSLGSAQIASIYFHKDADNSWTSYVYVDGTEVSQPGGDELNFTTDGALANVNGGAGTSISTNTFSPVSGATPMTFDIELGNITQFGNPFGVNFLSQDGYSTGRLDNFDIDPNGTIFGRYSNGQAKTMGQVVLAQFANSQGLQQIGDASWIETFPSGEPIVGAPGSGALGVLQSGSLEESNVDITEELVSMIGAQRSFQANAQVISTGDTLTQTIINIRR